MSRYTFIILFLILCVTQSVKGQEVTVNSSIDSLQILIGEQAKIKLEVSHGAKQRAQFPHFNDTIVRGVEVVDVSKPDTQYLNNKQRLLVTQEYTVTSFDSALYYLPPLEVKVDNKVYKSKALALKVYSVPVDTLHPERFFPQKTIMEAPFSWNDWIGMVLASLLAIPFMLLVIFLIIRFNDNKPIIRKIKIAPKLPPHEQAMEEIEKIKAEKDWQKERPKEYYTALTNVIRTYIEGRFRFNAMEMTSSEIIDKLLIINDKESIDDLKNLFETADLVKFAKHNPLMNENDANLISAIDFINETKAEEAVNNKPEPEEVTIEEKRSMRMKIILLSAIVLLFAAIAGLLAYAGIGIYKLYF